MTPEIIPPRVPQFNWVDLGLPSRTLWLDRLVGAESPSSPGLYYQWGAVVGHTATDGFSFNAASYSEQGLDAISNNLSESQDAARAFYGYIARMPSLQQVEELIQNTTAQSMPSHVLKLTSIINGKSILLYRGGHIVDTNIIDLGNLMAWLPTYYNASTAYSMKDLFVTPTARSRYVGLNVLAVHS